MKSKSHSHKNTKTTFVLLTLLLLLSSLLLSGCQSEPDTFRVGVLSGLNFVAGITDSFKDQMNELGYTEGENIEYVVQTTDFDIPTYQSILQQFVEDEVDLILVFPTEATIEAKNITEGTDIPVVFSFALIEGMGIVDSIREPGGNITGVRYPGPEVALRRFEVIRQIAPDKTDFILPYQNGYPIVTPQLEILRPAAADAGVNLIELPADNGEELASLLQEVSESENMENSAILILVEPLLVTPDGFAAAAEFAAEYQIPMGGVILPTEGFGSIFDVNVDIAEVGEQAALQADKVLQGTAAGTIPIISSEMTLIINNKQAEDLGLEVPEDLLAVANEVIR
jgi:putative ABC transport system substrate-binding protein